MGINTGRQSNTECSLVWDHLRWVTLVEALYLSGSRSQHMCLGVTNQCQQLGQSAQIDSVNDEDGASVTDGFHGSGSGDIHG